MSLENLTIPIIEPWFIPVDILRIVCAVSVITLSILFLLIIILDKTCHTVPLMLIANTCLAALIMGSVLLSVSIFTFQNDLKQIVYQDSLCVFRGYMIVGSGTMFFHSFLLQAVYRYIVVIYPTHLFWQSIKFQSILICSAWIFSFAYSFAFMFTDDIVYSIDDQICVFPIELRFSVGCVGLIAYVIPVSVIMCIYWKLVSHVKTSSKHVTPANILARAQRELKMVRQIVTLVLTLITSCFPYVLFLVLSIFKSVPKYHFRICYVFIDASVLLAMMILFEFTEPLKTSLMKIVKRPTNMIFPTTNTNGWY